MAGPKDMLTRDEAQARKKLLSHIQYSVHLELADDPAIETFRSTTTVTFNATTPGASTFINLDAREIEGIELNGTLIPKTAWSGGRIELANLAATNTLKIVARCAYNHTGVGLHRAQDPADGSVYLYTHFEPYDAHKVFACFDQPDLKGTFAFTIDAPQSWEVVNNTAEVQSSVAGSGRTRHEYARSKLMSTYLAALVAGPYAKVSTTHNGRELSLYCRKSMLPYLESDEIFEITRQGLDFYEKLFGIPYQFDKYAQIFVPESNMGAMENPGCTTFNEGYLFRSRVTDMRRSQRANVILHEMAHMWFGDLVTMEWWDDLWLNESFATYLSFLAQTEATRFGDAWTNFFFTRKSAALALDQKSTTHPIVADIPDTDAARQNFDGITYSKGASVLKQLAAVVGRTGLGTGLQEYCATYQWGNTRLAQFLAALEKGSGRKLGAWAKEWLQTKGMNTLSTEVTFRKGVISKAVIHQRVGAGDDILRSHHIGIGVYEKDAAGVLHQVGYLEKEISGSGLEIPELVGMKADCVILNDHDLGYAKFRLDTASQRVLKKGLSTIDDSLSRQMVTGMFWDMMRDGEMRSSEYITMLIPHVLKEKDPDAVQRTMQSMRDALLYADPAVYARLRERIAQAARDGVAAAEQGSDLQLAFFKVYAASAISPRQLKELSSLLSGKAAIPGLSLDLELRWSMLNTLASRGAASRQDIDSEEQRDRTDFGKRNAMTIATSRPDPVAKETAWNLLTKGSGISLAEMRALASGFDRAGQNTLLKPYWSKYEKELASWWQTRSPEQASTLTAGLYPTYRGDKAVLELGSILLARTDLPTTARRIIQEAHEGNLRLARCQEVDRAKSIRAGRSTHIGEESRGIPE
ncbi:MAG: aminopeptidase N [Candidatus Dormibacteria bacterium]